MRKFVLSVLMILGVLVPMSLNAQNISVASFKLLENDLTANTHGTMVRDQNGEVAALIKIVTTEKGFVFDGGMVGITNVKQEVGEVWVYVPHGIKKVTIKHEQLGVLRDYFFPVAIEKARTYEMVLTTGRVETVVTHSVNKQYVMFTVEPTNAVVELNDVPLEMDGNGFAEKLMPYGTYHYRISCTDYHTDAGQVVVSDQGKAEIKVALRPNFGWINFGGASQFHGANVYVDNECIGQLPLKSGAIKSGEHKVRVVKTLYKPYEQQMVVSDGEVTPFEVKMEPNFANVTLKTALENEVWIDGKQKGEGQWNGMLELGDYTIEVKRSSHRTASQVLHVTEVGALTVQLPSPTPIYGALDITSTPSRASVYIDDVKVGETPMIMDKVLIGLHAVTIKKEGYKKSVKSVEVKENATATLSETLSECTDEDEPADDDNQRLSVVKPLIQGNRYTYVVDGVSFTMVVVDGGTFTMGSARLDAEKSVTLADYAIGETEVTQELWQAVMQRNPSYYRGNVQNPVEYVSWNECQKFITMLNRLTGANFRLPTEAEWEYAARGGKESKGYRYSGSNTLGNVAWYISNSSVKPNPVKSKSPNELGLYDMSGNVSEWCDDRYYDFSDSSGTHAEETLKNDYFVFRGGSWSDSEAMCRVGKRNNATSKLKKSNRGLRLALTLDGSGL